MNKPSAILIDDEPDIRELLAISLERMGFECLQAGSYKEGQRLIQATECNLCITDVRMPDGSGIDLVRQFKMLHPNTPIAVMTAYDTTDIAIQAMKAGAFDFLAKPIRAKRLETLVADARLLSPTTSFIAPDISSETLIGEAPSMQALRAAINMASKSMAPVLISGEPGTGKELIARTIHHQSQRRYGPFISVDCGAIPYEILESEFFGHKKESFAGAGAEKAGLFQLAQGGSLLLNEIVELPIHFQVKLLRVLRERLVTAVGSEAGEPVEVRVLCATNKNLDSEVLAGTFREDLYYHINVIGLNVPALRHRPEDIGPLCIHLLTKMAGAASTTLDSSAVDALGQHTFPGNIRELENILYRAHAMCSGNVIFATDLNFSQAVPTVNPNSNISTNLNPLEISDLEEYLNNIEREIITAVLEAEKWNRTKAAKRLHLTTRQFRYKLAKYHLNKDE